MSLPILRAGVYRHYKGHLYLVLGYGHDSNHEGRNVVIYIGLELDGAKTGPRLAVRDVGDFFANVYPTTGETTDITIQQWEATAGSKAYPPVPRFQYIGPTWEGRR